MIHKRRAELHVQAARAVASLYPPDEYAEMIAFHYSRARASEAVEWLERAGDRAAGVFASETAIADYQAARRGLVERQAEADVLARLDEKLGTVLMHLGKYPEALEMLERAAVIHEMRRDLDAAGRLIAQIGMTHRYQGTLQDGIARVTPMIEALSPSGPSESLASLFLALANLFLLEGRWQDVYDAGERAAEIARVTGNERQLGEAEERRGTALQLVGRPDEGRRVIEAALPLIEREGDHIVLFRALNNAGEAAKLGGDIEAARRYTEHGLEVAERVGNPDQTSFILGNLAALYTVQGEWERAEQCLERAAAGAETLAPGSGHQAFLDAAAKLALERGEWDQAERHLEYALASIEQVNDHQFTESVRCLLGELNIMRGRPAEALRLLTAGGNNEGSLLGSTIPVLAWAYLEAGELDMAGKAASQGVERTRLEPLHLVEALRVQAMVWMRKNRDEEALGAVEEALELARGMPYPYAEGRLLVVKSDLLRRSRDAAEATRCLNGAVDIFRRLGA